MQAGGDIDGEAAGDRSGWSAALSADGNRLAVGAAFNDGNGSNAGHVRVYDFIGGTWVQAGGDIDGEAAFDQSGWSVALSADGSRVAIGAPFSGGNGLFAGYVRAYELTLPCQVSWYDAAGNAVGTGEVFDPVAANEVDPGTPGAYSFFAECVCAGCPSARTEAVFTVALPEPPTVQNYEICLDPVPVLALLGESMAVGGGRAVALSQLGQDIDGEAVLGQFGWSAALSADGSRVAVGAPSTMAMALTLVRCGCMILLGNLGASGRRHRRRGGGDQSGFSVALSVGGNRVVNRGALQQWQWYLIAGNVRVYDFIGERGCKRAGTLTARRAATDSAIRSPFRLTAAGW
ncbi:MAG: hypothetical protein H6559_03415 [Lewinellaceae bacterium]|nr:hypothetical protein [Lewinellaceae bacterium]